MEEDAGETRIPNAPRPRGRTGKGTTQTCCQRGRGGQPWPGRPGGRKRSHVSVTQGCDRSSPRRTSRKPEAIASVSLPERTQFNRGAGKSLNIVFSRGLRAARTGGVVAAIPFACHTVRRRQRKNLLPNNPPLGFSLGTVTTTETPSTEATPEHHRGCFNAPKFPATPDHTRPVAPGHTPVIPDSDRGPTTTPVTSAIPASHPFWPCRGARGVGHGTRTNCLPSRVNGSVQLHTVVPTKRDGPMPGCTLGGLRAAACICQHPVALP